MSNKKKISQDFMAFSIKKYFKIKMRLEEILKMRYQI